MHVHHLIHFLTGGKAPLELIGDQSTYGRFDSILDNVYCLARYEDDVRVQTWFGKTAFGFRNGLRVRVFGSLASAEWYQMQLQFSSVDGGHLMMDRGSGEADLTREPRYNRFKSGHPSGFIEAFANLYTDIADHLHRHKAGQSPADPFVYGARESEQGLRLLEAIARSAGSRTWQKV